MQEKEREWLQHGECYEGIQLPALRSGGKFRLFHPDGEASVDLPGEIVEEC